MIGINTLIFNQATMIVAMQHYLDEVLFSEDHEQIVKQVKVISTTGSSELFHITVEPKAD